MFIVYVNQAFLYIKFRRWKSYLGTVDCRSFHYKALLTWRLATFLNYMQMNHGQNGIGVAVYPREILCKIWKGKDRGQLMNGSSTSKQMTGVYESLLSMIVDFYLPNSNVWNWYAAYDPDGGFIDLEPHQYCHKNRLCSPNQDVRV